MKKIVHFLLLVLVLIAGLLVLVACDTPNGSSWRSVSGLSERTFDDGFSIALNSASRGTRNRTFTLNEEELANIHIHHHSSEGEVVLTISQNGNLDGTEIILSLHELPHIVNIDASSFEAGRIRFAFSFEAVENSSTSVAWGSHGYDGY
ncbi:MAG: hypothetical protein FWE44_07195 [Defluviitaleaceae bacterium]|nr:hypothetical protein [Defluviitaleaceae bacterium]